MITSGWLRILFLPVAAVFLMSSVVFAQSAEKADPGELAQIVLNLSAQQLVGHVLLPPSQIFLLDENSDLVPAYDLSASPIILTSSKPGLHPDTLSDTSLFADGVINFAPALVKYTGTSGAAEILATNGTVASNKVLVSFSGYDALGAFDILGRPFTSVYSDLPTELKVEVSNGGDLMAVSDPTLRAFFASGGGSVQVFFAPHSNGRIDTVTISLPTDGLTIGTDTLLLVLQSTYFLAGANRTVLDTLRLELEVLSSASFVLDEGSFVPTRVYAGIPFEIAFDVVTANFPGPVESTSLQVDLIDDLDSVVATIYSGSVDSYTLAGDTIRYDSLIAECPLSAAPGEYELALSYHLVSEGNIFTFTTSPSVSLTILPQQELSFVSGSFTPVLVASGQEAYFEFDLSLTGTEVAFVDGSASQFGVLGSGFSTVTNLKIAGDSLVPGISHITSERVFIPEDQLGRGLNVNSAIAYAQAGSGNSLTFATTFEDVEIEVGEVPVVQIARVTLEAINSPKVNTQQAFRIQCAIANGSASDQGPFEIEMVSDGSSVFTDTLTVPGVPANDTTEVYFDVIAADSSNEAEIFRVDITGSGVVQLPPDDNIALANVQLPADLELTYGVLGADSSYLNIGDDFSVGLILTNAGEAASSAGVYEVTAHGLDIGLPSDPYLLSVSVVGAAVVSLQAPLFDTTIVLDFTLVDPPLDLNTNQPAQLSDTAFQIVLSVTTPGVNLLAEGQYPESPVVLPGGAKDLFVLRLINPGLSSVTDVHLQSASILFRDRLGLPVNVRSVLEVAVSGFYHNGSLVTAASAGDDRMNLLFTDDLTVVAGDTVALVFRARVKAAVGDAFSAVLKADDITGIFINGPLAGEAVAVTTADPDGEIVNRQFTTVEASLDGSFVVRQNPFNPALESAEFQYFVSQPSNLEFRVLTLTGELVYSRDIPASAEGALVGLHTLIWDGRNDEGFRVLNGVYVVVLAATQTGERASLKLAVLK